MSVNHGADQFVTGAAEIVAAYVANNAVSVASVPEIIRQVHAALAGLAIAAPADQPQVDRKPAVAVRKSVHPDFLICLEDGKKFKSLKRYLRTQYSLTPEQYRAKWRLPHDYPMVAPNYARARSDLAKSMGLGRLPVPSRKRS